MGRSPVADRLGNSDDAFVSPVPRRPPDDLLPDAADLSLLDRRPGDAVAEGSDVGSVCAGWPDQVHVDRDDSDRACTRHDRRDPAASALALAAIDLPSL